MVLRNFCQAYPAQAAEHGAMASIRREFRVAAPAARVWDAFRDIGRVHTRLAPGVVTACRIEGADRIVTFANGLTTREVIVDLDEAAMRLAYSAQSERLQHHCRTGPPGRSTR